MIHGALEMSFTMEDFRNWFKFCEISPTCDIELLPTYGAQRYPSIPICLEHHGATSIRRSNITYLHYMSPLSPQVIVIFVTTTLSSVIKPPKTEKLSLWNITLLLKVFPGEGLQIFNSEKTSSFYQNLIPERSGPTSISVIYAPPGPKESGNWVVSNQHIQGFYWPWNVTCSLGGLAKRNCSGWLIGKSTPPPTSQSDFLHKNGADCKALREKVSGKEGYFHLQIQ